MSVIRARAIATRAYYGLEFGGTRQRVFLDLSFLLLKQYTEDPNVLAAVYLQDVLEDTPLPRATLEKFLSPLLFTWVIQLGRPQNRVGFDYAAYYERLLQLSPILPLARLANLTRKAEIAKNFGLALVLARIRTENTTIQSILPERIFEDMKARIYAAVAV